MNTRWIINKDVDKQIVANLSDVLGIDENLATLLVQRGINNYDEAKDFFRPSLTHLHDPFLMKDMDKAVERVKKAWENGEKILIYGDYDVDGTTAVALIYSYLKNFISKKKIEFYIPDRYDEGYGISYKGIDYAADNGFNLVIVLDCGIKAVDKIEYANSRNVDFIICDHHRPGDTIPNAVAVLDSKRPDCQYPYKELSGCGVGFKLITALSMSFNRPIEEVYELSDAILKGEEHELSKELGDVLLHVLFYAKIGEEKQHFDIVDVINFLCDKLIYRHPHVFSTAEVGDAEGVIKQWEMLKTTEKDGNKRVLSGVPDGLPPLLKAYRMQDKARGVGFDWEKKEDVWEKVKEEVGEYQAELDAMAAAQTEEERAAAYDRAEDELGDFLFAAVNAARLYGLNPDTALERTCAKFRRRFTYLEEHTIRQGRNLTDMTLAEMDAIWDEGKAKGL